MSRPNRRPRAAAIEAALRRAGDNCGHCGSALEHLEMTAGGFIGRRLVIIGRCCTDRLATIQGFEVYIAARPPVPPWQLELRRPLRRGFDPPSPPPDAEVLAHALFDSIAEAMAAGQSQITTAEIVAYAGGWPRARRRDQLARRSGRADQRRSAAARPAKRTWR